MSDDDGAMQIDEGDAAPVENQEDHENQQDTNVTEQSDSLPETKALEATAEEGDEAAADETTKQTEAETEDAPQLSDLFAAEAPTDAGSMAVDKLKPTTKRKPKKRQKPDKLSPEEREERKLLEIVRSKEVEEQEKHRLECLGSMQEIEKEFSALKEQFYQDQLRVLQQEIETVKLGSSKEFLDEVKNLENSKELRMWSAEQWKAFQIRNIESMFDAEIALAKDEFGLEKKNLANKMIQDIEDQQKKLEEEKDNMDLSLEGMELQMAMPRPKRRREEKSRRKLNPPHVNYTLKDSEIYEDLTAFSKKPPGSLDRANLYELLADVISSTTDNTSTVPEPPTENNGETEPKDSDQTNGSKEDDNLEEESETGTEKSQDEAARMDSSTDDPKGDSDNETNESSKEQQTEDTNQKDSEDTNQSSDVKEQDQDSGATDANTDEKDDEQKPASKEEDTSGSNSEEVDKAEPEPEEVGKVNAESQDDQEDNSKGPADSANSDKMVEDAQDTGLEEKGGDEEDCKAAEEGTAAVDSSDDSTAMDVST